MTFLKRNGADLTPTEVGQVQTDLSVPANTITALAAKTNTGHAHVVADVTGLSAALATKADLLSAVTETGTAWTLTKAAHTNRDVIATNAAAITVSVNTSGMDTSDGGRVIQGGAGTVTFTGVAGYSGGVTNTPTIPAGIGNWVDWWYNGTGIVFQAKSEDATGGGASASVAYDVTAASASAAIDVDDTLATLTVPSRKAGDKTSVVGFLDIGSTGDPIEAKIIWGGQIFDFETLNTGVASLPFELHILHLSATSHVAKAWGATSGLENSSANTVLTLNAAASTTMTFVVKRKVTATRAATLIAMHAHFIDAP